MAQCHMCGRRIGWGDANSRKLGPERLPTCRDCVPEWRRKEKEEVLAALSRPDAPVERFRIHEVRHHDPTNPAQPETLYGTLLFTHKAVIFAASGTVKEANPGVTMQFGLIGALYGYLKTNKSRKQAVASVTQIPEDTAGALEHASRLIVIPKDDIRQIKYGWASGMKIKTTDKKQSKAFHLTGGRRVYDVFRPAIEEYGIAGRGGSADVLGPP